jgi:tripartite-type tricarboxylate transporter receptor subunit TctC
VLPGDHLVVGRRAGFLTISRSLGVIGGDQREVDIALVSLHDAAVTRTRWATWKPWAVTATGTAVALLGTVPNMLVINPALPIQNVEQYIAFARANPGKLTCASSGAGSAIHMSCELFKIQTNTNILHVPYKGSSLALNDLLGGQVSSIFDNMPSVLQQVRAGKLRALGVTTATRSSFAPEIPTLAESGLPDFSVQAWFGLFAPSATEPSLLKRVNANVTQALTAEATKTSYASAGIALPSNPNTVDMFTDFVNQEVQKWAIVVMQSGTETQ